LGSASAAGIELVRGPVPVDLLVAGQPAQPGDDRRLGAAAAAAGPQVLLPSEAPAVAPRAAAAAPDPQAVVDRRLVRVAAADAARAPGLGGDEVEGLALPLPVVLVVGRLVVVRLLGPG